MGIGTCGNEALHAGGRRIVVHAVGKTRSREVCETARLRCRTETANVASDDTGSPVANFLSASNVFVN